MKKLKVLLTNAPAFNLERFDRNHSKIRGYSLYPPISLTTLAAAILKKVDDTQVEILDLEFEIMKFFKENDESLLSTRDAMKNIILDKIEELQPDLVGISTMFSISHKNTFEIANIVKEKKPTTKVISGGNHSTFTYKRMLKECPNIDYIFLYEADTTFPLFLEYLKGKSKFEDLKGLAWLDKNTSEPNLSPYATVIHDLDPLPIPKWNLVPIKKYQKYGRIGSINSFGDENIPSYVMQTVRGCVASCCFCSVRGFYGKGVRAYSSERVLKEIDYLYNDLGIKQLEIVDDDFTFDRKRTLEICNGLAKRNYDLVWNLLNGIRLGTINDEVMDSLVKSKCRLISIGVESGNDSTLAIVRKPLSIKMLYRKAEIIHQHPELYVKGNYIVGFPFESDEETMNTYNLAEDIGFDWNIFSVFKPLPGTPMFQNIDKKSQENFDFGSVKNDFQFDALRHYKNIEKKINKTEASQHGDEGFYEERDSKDEERDSKDNDISRLAYIKNLEINFIKNKNLNGRNVDRAIRDFEGILRFIEKDHPIAHYCLAKAYQKKGNNKLVKQNMKKISDILANPMKKKWVEYFNKLVPKNEINKLHSAV